MRTYTYIGPPALFETAATATTGETISSAEQAAAWVSRHREDAGPDSLTPATFVVTAPDGLLRLAPRRSEHVHCARGGGVLCAGEIYLRLTRRGIVVEQITNQSTGYAPEPGSWPAIAAALDSLGIPRPDAFEPAFEFRRCPSCRQLCLIKEGDFTCAVCGTELPAEWNVA